MADYIGQLPDDFDPMEDFKHQYKDDYDPWDFQRKESEEEGFLTQKNIKYLLRRHLK